MASSRDPRTIVGAPRALVYRGPAILPGDADQYASSPGSAIDTTDDTVVSVLWRGWPRYMYFQDGPYFWLHDDAEANVVATYPNGTIAAITAPYGNGHVAVAGPHPGADRSWYADSHLANPDGSTSTWATI